MSFPGRPHRRSPVRPLLLALTLAAAPLAFAAEASAGPGFSWIVRYSPGDLDLGEGIAIDPNGETWVTGIATADGDQNQVTARFNATGGKVWSAALEGTLIERGEDVAVDPAGNVYLAATQKTPFGDDVVLRKLAPDGSTLWTKVFDKGTSEAARALAIDPWGDLLVTGASLSMNGGDGFIAKFSPDGEERWAKAINLYWLDEAFDVAAGPDGEIVVVGRVLREGQFDRLVRKFTRDGDVAWSQVGSTPGHDEARGVAIAPDGGVYVTGTTMTHAGNATHLDFLVERYTASGDREWTRALDLAGGDDEGRKVALDPSGNLLLVGFGLVEGTKDAAVVKLTPDGNEVWRETWNGGGTDGLGAVAVHPVTGRVVATGATERGGTDYDYLVLALDEGRPSVAFRAPSDARAGERVQFEDASAPTDASLARWAWSFGDGGTSTQANPTHAFQWGGTYEVQLTVWDLNHNSRTATRTVVVDGPEKPTTTPPSTGSGSGDAGSGGTGTGSGSGSGGTRGPPADGPPPPASEQSETPGFEGALALAAAVGALLLARRAGRRAR